MSKTALPQLPRISTGSEGLDDILHGGFPQHRLYLVQGEPGSGKTTLALQFLIDGARQGEKGLYVTFSETADELRVVAQSHGWSLDGITLHELSHAEHAFKAESQNTFFHPSEVELNEATRPVLEIVEKTRPTRIVFDSLSEMRLLAGDPLRYRRQILALKQFFSGRACTVLLLDDRTSGAGDLQLESIAHGVILLEQLSPGYGAERRRLRVVKMRGSKFRGGYHDFNIQPGGLVIYPRLVASEHPAEYEQMRISSGLRTLDELVGGGLDRGTSTLLLGPAGVGKSALSTQYVAAAAARGENAAVFMFDESRETYFARAASLGIDVKRHADAGRVSVQQVDPAALSPGEFACQVREAVEKRGARIVVIDSLNGYLVAMPEEKFLTIQLHEVLSYLGHKGVATMLIVAQHGLMGPMNSPVDVSYLADTVILLRYFEAQGAIRQAISVMKKRKGGHERTIREFGLSNQGIQIGHPLVEFHGVLTGVPVYRGSGKLLRDALTELREAEPSMDVQKGTSGGREAGSGDEGNGQS